MEIGRKSGIINFNGTTCFRFVSDFSRIDIPGHLKADKGEVNPQNFKWSPFNRAQFHISGTLVDCIDVLEFDESEDEQMTRGLFKAYIVDLRTDQVWQTDRPFVARDEMGARMKVLIQARDFITSEDEIDMYHIGVERIASIPDQIAPKDEEAPGWVSKLLGKGTAPPD